MSDSGNKEVSAAVYDGDAARKSAWRRWGPLAALTGLMSVAYAMGWYDYVSFKTVGLNYEAMRAFISENLLVALLIYMGVYIAAIALSLPGGLILTLSGGLLFGWQIGAPATIVAATIGATIVFLIAKTSFGESLADRAGPWLARLRDGFRENALNYLLFLRLVPAFPFFVVNLAPALLGVPLRTYVIGTFFGIIPGTLAYSVAGSGLGSVVEAQNSVYRECIANSPGGDCPYSIDTSALVTKEIIAAFVLIGIVALIPVLLKKWKMRHGGQERSELGSRANRG